MRLKSVDIENFRAIGRLKLSLDPMLTVLHGDNASGKSSVLGAIAVGLEAIIRGFPNVTSFDCKNADRRQKSTDTSVELTTNLEDSSWRCVSNDSKKYDIYETGSFFWPYFDVSTWADDIPIFIIAYYDTDRAVIDLPKHSRDFKKSFSRFGAWEGALSAKSDFLSVIEWFYAKQHEEFYEQKNRGSFDYVLKDLEAVRRAIASMIDGASDSYIEPEPLRFVMTLRTEAGGDEKLPLEELSGGNRNMLALVADLARRMAQGNPHLDDPLQSEAIVLIDEVDLHLHPSWQQRVLGDLMRTFPNTQFIVSTHSPQVLSTVKPEHIVLLSRRDGEIFASRATSATYGAESGHILQTEMGVSERPKNDFSEALAEYFTLIDHGEHESERARHLRQLLEELSPQDTGLDRATGEIRRRQVLKSLGRNP